MLKIVLIELNRSHDECLYSQVKFIKDAKQDTHLTLVCNKALEPRVKHFDGVDHFEYVQFRPGLKEWIDLFRFSRWLKKRRFDKIIFNTAQGRLIKNLFAFLRKRKPPIYGTLHRISKLDKSSGQKVISSKITSYFVLADYLKDSLDQTVVEKYNITAFYPIFFPTKNIEPIKKSGDEAWICIPGAVEYKRRDYESLIDGIRTHGLVPKVKFILLGGSGHSHGSGGELKTELSSLGVIDQFAIWDDFVDQETYDKYFPACDYVLPLIHENHRSAKLYKMQITGGFNLAIAHGKPLLLEKAFHDFSNFGDQNVIPYASGELIPTINSLESHSTQPFTEKRWSFEFQSKQYLKGLEIN